MFEGEEGDDENIWIPKQKQVSSALSIYITRYTSHTSASNILISFMVGIVSSVSNIYIGSDIYKLVAVHKH